MRSRDRHEGLSRRPDRDGVALDLGEGVGVVDEDLKSFMFTDCVVFFKI